MFFSIRQSLHSDRNPLKSLKQAYPPQVPTMYMARRTKKGLTSKNGYKTDIPEAMTMRKTNAGQQKRGRNKAEMIRMTRLNLEEFGV